MTNLARSATAAVLAAATVFAVSAPAAFADPAPAPAPGPNGTGSALQNPSPNGAPQPSVLDTPNRPYAVVNVSALPLNATAKWRPVTGHTYTAPVLTGIAVCSPYGKPVADRIDGRAKATSPVYAAPLSAAGDAQGWTATISGAAYPDVASASYALNAYRAYLNTCPLAGGDDTTNGATGTSALDPTTAHALIGTNDSWIEVFAVATNSGVIELVYRKPKNGPVSFGYNPQGTFAALKAADLGALSRKV